MEENLDTAPTEKELDNAGFKRKTHDEDGYNYTYSKSIGDNLKIEIHTDYKRRCASLYIYDGTFLKNVDLTKAAINAEFKHFGESLPQWEKAKLKVGEVWESDINTIVITPSNSSKIINVFYIASSYDNYLLSGTFTGATDLKDAGYKKVADSLEQYYKGEKQQPQPVEQPYSHSNLKKSGLIPFHRSEEDQKSIKAFEKLIEVSNAINEGNTQCSIWRYYYIDEELEAVGTDCKISGIHFINKIAAQTALKQNRQLFIELFQIEE